MEQPDMTSNGKSVYFKENDINSFQGIGLELEHFICDNDYHIISCEEIGQCLEEACPALQGTLCRKQDSTRGILCENFAITPEPGCRLKISVTPRNDMEEIRNIYQRFRNICAPIFEDRGFYLLEKGVFPLIENSEMEADGMYATAATKVSVCFSSEEDAQRKMRILSKLAPVISLLTENRNGLGSGNNRKPHLIRNQIRRDTVLQKKEQSILYCAADSMPIEYALGYAALIKTILYDNALLEMFDKALSHIQTTDAVYQAESTVMDKGYHAKIYGKPIMEWLEDLFTAALRSANEKEKTYICQIIPLPVLNDRYKKLVAGKESLHKESAASIRSYLLSSTAKYHNRVVRTLYLPKLFTNKEVNKFHQEINTLYGIFDKVITEYERNEAYRHMFGFPKELEDLILRRPKYHCNIPIARIDIFYHEETGDFRFCEFNTDGTSAMNEDRELNTAFEDSLAYQEFSKIYPLQKFELFDTWVEEAIRLYREYAGDDKALPSVAIVDFMEHATTNEFLIFRERFERKGCMAQLCDIRKLTWDGKNCFSGDGTKIDLIYRRAVTSDIMAHYQETSAFINAVKADAVCVLGDFRTQIVHNKVLFKILHKPETLRLLSRKEQTFIRAHVPLTISLDELDNPEYAWVKKDVFTRKDNWIIKPEDSYGSQGVHAGVELADQEEWNRLLADTPGQHYILQQFNEPYRLDNIDLSAENDKWVDTANLTGLFVYNAKFSGIYSRISFDKMISTQYNEMSLPSVIVG